MDGGWWTELVGEDGVEMGRTYTTRMGCVSGDSPSVPRNEIHPNKVAPSARAPWVSWAGNRMTTMACARIAQWNPGFKVPCTYHRVRTGVREARQAQTGTSRGTTGPRRTRGSRTHLPGRPGAARSRCRNSRSPLFVMQSKRRKQQQGGGQARARGRVTERSLEKWRQVLYPL